MPQMTRIGKCHTQIIRQGLETIVKLYATPVVTICPEQVILNTGGWETQTTKVRMNQASNVYNLGYYVYQKQGIWYVHYNNQTHQFIGNKCILWRPQTHYETASETMERLSVARYQ